MLKNTWYAAAWSDELVHGRPLGRRFLNEPVVMFRQADGTPVALSDLCPHRFAPLHRGKQVGDVIQCGYHGLEFGADGRCVRNPHGKGVPSGARVRRYPMVERYNLLWIWPGAGEPDDTLIPGEFAFLTESGRAHNRGYINANANYLLMLDNLMDVSHALYLHSGSLTTEDMRQNYEPKVGIEDGVTKLVINQYEVVPPPFWAAALPPGTERVDVRETSHGHMPSLVMHEMVYSQVGRPPYSEGGVSSRSAHLYTPETDGTTHYFYCLSRDFHRDDAEVHEKISAELHRIFTTEDVPMIEAQQRLIGDRDLMSMKPALIHTDKASVLMRRHLAGLIEKEKAAAGELAGANH
ncbi:aromatic ring-hydroxylating dioxygenase subunit alpha [Amycolatopsis pithecellobii]|nr:aromatic ring-hydroxylating dioxygenase subunit alpha [Amycolatopsis pithecellobii]